MLGGEKERNEKFWRERKNSLKAIFRASMAPEVAQAKVLEIMAEKMAGAREKLSSEPGNAADPEGVAARGTTRSKEKLQKKLAEECRIIAAEEATLHGNWPERWYAYEIMSKTHGRMGMLNEGARLSDLYAQFGELWKARYSQAITASAPGISARRLVRGTCDEMVRDAAAKLGIECMSVQWKAALADEADRIRCLLDVKIPHVFGEVAQREDGLFRRITGEVRFNPVSFASEALHDAYVSLGEISRPCTRGGLSDLFWRDWKQNYKAEFKGATAAEARIKVARLVDDMRSKAVTILEENLKEAQDAADADAQREIDQKQKADASAEEQGEHVQELAGQEDVPPESQEAGDLNSLSREDSGPGEKNGEGEQQQEVDLSAARELEKEQEGQMDGKAGAPNSIIRENIAPTETSGLGEEEAGGRWREVVLEALLTCGEEALASSIAADIGTLDQKKDVRALACFAERLSEGVYACLVAAEEKSIASRSTQIYGSKHTCEVVDAVKELAGDARKAMSIDGLGEVGTSALRLCKAVEKLASSRNENLGRQRRRAKASDKAAGVAENAKIIKEVYDPNCYSFLIGHSRLDVPGDLLTAAARCCIEYFDACVSGVNKPVSMLQMKQAFPSAFAPASASVFGFMKMLPCVAIWPSGLEKSKSLISEESLGRITLFHSGNFYQSLVDVSNDMEEHEVTSSGAGACDPALEEAEQDITPLCNIGDPGFGDEPAGHSNGEGVKIFEDWSLGKKGARAVWDMVKKTAAPAMDRSKNEPSRLSCFTTAEIYHALKEGPEALSLRYIQKVVTKLRSARIVAPITIHKIAPRHHARVFWAINNMRYREEMGAEMAASGECRYVRMGCDDMSKIPALQVLQTKRTSKKGAKYALGPDAAVVNAPDHDFAFASRALLSLSGICVLEPSVSGNKRASVTLAVRPWRYCPSSIPGHISDIARLVAAEREQWIAGGAPVFLHISVDNGADYSCNNVLWIHFLFLLWRSRPEIAAICCGAHAPYHSALHWQAESLWGDIKPAIHGELFGATAREDVIGRGVSVRSDEGVKAIIHSAMQEFGRCAGEAVSKSAPCTVIYRGSNEWPSGAAEEKVEGDEELAPAGDNVSAEVEEEGCGKPEDELAASYFPWYNKEYYSKTRAFYHGPVRGLSVIPAEVKEDAAALTRHCVNMPQSIDIAPCQEDCRHCCKKPRVIPEIWGGRMPLAACRKDLCQEGEDGAIAQEKELVDMARPLKMTNGYVLYRSQTEDPPIARKRRNAETRCEKRYLSYKEARDEKAEGRDLRMVIPTTMGAEEKCDVRETVCDRCPTFFRYISEKTRHMRACAQKKQAKVPKAAPKAKALKIGKPPPVDSLQEPKPKKKTTRKRKAGPDCAENVQKKRIKGTQVELGEDREANQLVFCEEGDLQMAEYVDFDEAGNQGWGDMEVSMAGEGFVVDPREEDCS